MSGYRFQVIADSSGQWASNGQVFATREDAEASAKDLASRWYAVMEWRVIETHEEPNQTGPTIKGAGHRVKL